ncbi:MAG: single-stranded-DNA-specific exonuclease RecJ [Leptospirales bacterium]|nr:single-stranded-DNA-specific exonuclease RecJ [Leptospirales bacterium]
MKENWRVRDAGEPLIEELSRELSLDARLVRLAANRGYESPREIRGFLNPHPSKILNPFLLNGMREAVALVREALATGRRIGVFTDSDLDGLTSLALLRQVFSKQAELVCRFPKNDETYGLTTGIIDEFHAAHCGLIITADSGIRDLKEIAYARSLGINVIVTDHHEPDAVLPDAVIINPKRSDCRYPYKQLAGVGVAFKFCLGLLLSYLPSYKITFLLVAALENSFAGVLVREGVQVGSEIFGRIEDAAEYIAKAADEQFHIVCENKAIKDALASTGRKVYSVSELLPAAFNGSRQSSPAEIAAILGVEVYESADKVLTDVFFELQRISSPKITAFIDYALSFVSIGSIADVVPLTGENRVLTACGLNTLGKIQHDGLAKALGGGKIDSKRISWELAPLLNSPGRFGNAALTADFFMDTPGVLERIRKINEERKKLIQLSVEKSRPRHFGNKFAAVFYDDIPEGMAGLIANRLLDNMRKPVIAFAYPQNGGLVKGSGRAEDNVDFLSAAESAGELFERIGGHPQAFGFTLKPENVEPFLEKISLFMEGLNTDEPALYIDMEIRKNDITSDFLTLIAFAGPFGKGNEEPLFLLRGVRLDSFARFGNDNSHAKFVIDRDRNISAVGWGMADAIEKLSKTGLPVDMVFNIADEGSWGIKLMIKDIG